MYERIEWYDGRMHDVVSDSNATAAAKPDKHITRAVAIMCTYELLGSILSISPFVLPQLSGPWQQPASAAASRRVLEPDILKVSHLCGCMY